VVWFTVSIERVKLSFVPGLEVEFSDRNKAIRQVIEWSEKSTPYPVVVFGPEGCGKTAWLKQAIEPPHGIQVCEGGNLVLQT
jgi:predicted AAA+ superfamily ATPase